MAKHDQPAFQGHHVIEQDAYERNKLLQKLEARNLFALHGDRNLLNLPADKQLALRLEVTPHNGGPLGQYSKGLERELEFLRDSPDGEAFLQQKNLQAGQRIAAQVNHLCDTLKVAMVNGDLLTNTPEGMTPKAANAKNAAFFENLPEYQRTHAIQIEAVGKLTGPEARWPVVLQSESHLTASLERIDQPGHKTIKGNAARGLQSLSDAVDSAQDNGRLVLTEQGAATVEHAFRVPRGQRGYISPELLVGDLSTNQALRMGGIAASGYDAYQTTMRTSELWSQDNATAADEQWMRFGARNLAGWGGGTLTAAAVGTTGAGPLVLVAADAYLLVEAADKAVTLWQNEKIYTQKDRDELGVEWKREGTSWIREDLRTDQVNDGIGEPQPARYSARPEKAQQLSYQASVEAAEQALGHVPTPRNPFVQPVLESDAAHLHTMRWAYSTESGRWSRMVADAVDREGAPEWNADPEYASPERTAQLNAQALQAIDENLKAGPAAIAMRYQFGHKAYGYGEVGEVPAAVTTAMTTDRLRASDDRTYERDAQGAWIRDGEPAPAPRALELELTRERLLSGMQEYEKALARIPEWTPPTPEQADRAELRRQYVNHHRNPDVRLEEFEAAYAAVQRTRSDHGIGPENTALELGPMTAGQSIADIEIRHTHRAGADGKDVVPVAITTPNDIAAELRERQTQGQQEQSPTRTAPEQIIAIATPEQRDAREQAQREANRQGLSHDDAQQVARAAAVGASVRGVVPADGTARTTEPASENAPQREHVQDAPAVQSTAQAAAIQAMMEGPRDPDTLYPGNRNDQVALLQYRLDQQGYRGIEGQPLPQHGHYDLDTVYAVAKFQQAHDLPATGIADQPTQYAAAYAPPMRQAVQPAPERTITQATPEERDARGQAQREANRQGLSKDETQQAAHAAAVSTSARGIASAGGAARTDEQTPENTPQRERASETPTAQEVPLAATAVAAMVRDAREEDTARLERERAETDQTGRATREQGQPPTVAATPEPERIAAKIETTATPERQTETPPPNPADHDPQHARAVATPATAAHAPDALRLGDRGDAVELLQYRLDRQGCRGGDGAPIPQTGQYGVETEQAVRQFQTLHGIPATGVADQGTRNAVDRALAAQRERERAEQAQPSRSLSPESTRTSETPTPATAPRSVGLTASGGRDVEDRRKREPEHAAHAEVQPTAPTTTAPDPTLAHRAATRDERDDERQSRAGPDRTQPATPEPSQSGPVQMAQPAHPAHAMYTQALSLIEHGDAVPAGTMTQEEKSKLAAGVVAQFLAEDNRATRIDALYASTHNAPGMPAALIPVQGDPTTAYCRRASIDVSQALHTPLEQSSQTAQKAIQDRQQELAQEQAKEQARKERQETEGPVMRIGPRTLSQGPQGDGGDGGGGDGDGGDG